MQLKLVGRGDRLGDHDFEITVAATYVIHEFLYFGTVFQPYIVGKPIKTAHCRCFCTDKAAFARVFFKKIIECVALVQRFGNGDLQIKCALVSEREG